MIASFLITFREALEAALIIGIIAAYLSKVGRGNLNRYLYLGSGSAVLGSILLGWIFMAIYGGLSGKVEEIFEGLAALTAAAVLTYMIFWMGRNAQRIKGELQEQVEVSISRGQLFGIATLAFVAVFREGVETVLFLGILALQDSAGTLVGLVMGLAAVIILALLTFKGIYRLNIRKFFQWTSVLLLIFAAGLVAYGVHELNEAGIVPPVIEHLWDINPSQNPNGGYPLLHEKGATGSRTLPIEGGIVMQLKSTIKCPKCGVTREEIMPIDACQYFYECTNCKAVLKPKQGDCCVFCSYGSVKCPPKQKEDYRR